jgi:hypothetical protein
MSEQKITNEMLFELLKKIQTEMQEFKTEIRSELREFKHETYQRFQRIEKRLDRIEDNRDTDHKLLLKILDSRDKVSVKFSTQFAGINALFAGVVAFVVSFFYNRFH